MRFATSRFNFKYSRTGGNTASICIKWKYTATPKSKVASLDMCCCDQQKILSHKIRVIPHNLSQDVNIERRFGSESEPNAYYLHLPVVTQATLYFPLNSLIIFIGLIIGPRPEVRMQGCKAPPEANDRAAPCATRLT